MSPGCGRGAQRATETVAEQAIEQQLDAQGVGNPDVDLGSDVDISALPEALAGWKMMAEVEQPKGRMMTFQSADGTQTATITIGRDDGTSLTQIGVLHIVEQG